MTETKQPETFEQYIARRVAEFREALIARGIGSGFTVSPELEGLVRDYLAHLLRCRENGGLS